MGVELMDSAGQGGSTAESISTALKSISDPMLELSMLQSLNDVIDSVSFSENKLGALVSSRAGQLLLRSQSPPLADRLSAPPRTCA